MKMHMSVYDLGGIRAHNPEFMSASNYLATGVGRIS